ncbi:MAG: hypothetical protein JWN72_2225 [Thermoleophilia bacterium]|nr:hypothetical protein [Thermoleophilia bacterium]
MGSNLYGIGPTTQVGGAYRGLSNNRSAQQGQYEQQGGPDARHNQYIPQDGLTQGGGASDAQTGARVGGAGRQGGHHVRQTPEARATDLFTKADTNGDGSITRTELLESFSSTQAPAATATTTAAVTAASDSGEAIATDGTLAGGGSTDVSSSEFASGSAATTATAAQAPAVDASAISTTLTNLMLSLQGLVDSLSASTTTAAAASDATVTIPELPSTDPAAASGSTST